jgi:ADP-heptose:LPS heptosyltransferase
VSGAASPGDDRRARTLVLHPGALGDVLLAIPALRALRRARPEAPLELAAQPRIAALLAALGVVDAEHPFDALGLEALFGDTPDARRPLPALAGTGRLVSWFGARDPEFVARLRAQAAEVIVASSAPPPETLVWRHLLATVGGAEPADCTPLTVSAPLRAAGRMALERAGWSSGPLLIVHPGAGGVTKRWPAAGFARVADGLAARPGLAVLLHEGPTDTEAVAAVQAMLARPLAVVRRPSLTELAGALAHATAYVGNDSGISHLAAAVGAPALALFATDNVRWQSWSPAARARVVATAALAPGDAAGVLADLGRLLA